MITVQFKLCPTLEQEKLLVQITREYIASVNALLDYCAGQIAMPKLSSASFRASLPSVVKNEAVNAAKSILQKHRRGKCDTLPVLKKPVATWNNQNYRVEEGELRFPVWINGRSQRIAVRAVLTDHQRERLADKLGTLRITQKSGKWIAQIAVHTLAASVSPGDAVMGVDLGLKVPAAAVTSTGKTKFFGNGRRNKYMKRKHRAHRKALGKAKKQKAIDRLSNKEQRWMRDQDHKISRDIVNFAAAQKVGTIRLEKLQNIRQTARTSRKNEKNLHTWSFYRLANFIEYKANMVGITVEYINPAYTSQSCPSCGKRNHAKDRRYECSCGFTAHRDRVGAINIMDVPVIAGNRQSA